MNVSQLMTTYPRSLEPSAAIRRAAKMMRAEDVTAIPVLDNVGALVGMISDRDIVVGPVADGMGTDTPVSYCMTRLPESLAPDTTIEQAMRLMATLQRDRMPVVENGRLVGILTREDIAKSIESHSEQPDMASDSVLEVGDRNK